MSGFKAFYDITIFLDDQIIVYPGDPPYTRDLFSSIARGAITDVSRLSMSVHTGTHLDAPAHFLQGAKTIDTYPVEKFVLPAQVVEIKNEESITTGELERVTLEPGAAVLFKTANSARGLASSGKYSGKYVFLSTEAAAWCAARGASLVGIDYINVDRHGDISYPAHHVLLENGILILETLDLGNVPPGKYTLFCFPLKIKGGEASPVRAVLAAC